MPEPVSSFDRLSQLDPTGAIDLQDPAAVEMAIGTIFDRRYAGRYDAALLRRALADIVRAFRGEYPGLLRCDTLYHDLRHALETGLTMTRLIDGHAIDQAAQGAAAIDAAHALLGILLALFHDVGLLRRDAEAHLWGPALTPIHEERGVEFMNAYLADTTLAPLLDQTKLIMATKPVYVMPADWSPPERLLASLLATADLVSQSSDRCYLEKCRDFLFLEFSAFGLAGREDAPYPDSKTLLEKTPDFFDSFLQKRLDVDFQGVRRYLRIHMGGTDPWHDAMQNNIGYLKALIRDKELDRLRRHPQRYIGDLPPD